MKKRRNIIIFLIVTALLLIIMITANHFFFMVKSRQIILNTFFVTEDDTLGVDISSYQGDVDMDRLMEQNIQFVYIKATEGSKHVDVKFEQNWENARESGILRGAYHFFSYDSSGEKQARNFIKTVGGQDGCLIPMVDVEYYGDKEDNPPDKEDLITELQAYLDTLEEEYHVKPMIYTRLDLYRTYLRGNFEEYKKWMCSYYYPLRWELGDDWYIWQYSDIGELDGLDGGIEYVDLDVLNKNKDIGDLIIPSE